MKTIIKNERIGYVLITAMGLIALVAIFLKGPIIQDQCYHRFSDANAFLDIENFWNVISNLPFLIVGCLGLFKMKCFEKLSIQYLMFFLGILLVSLGSSYYHLNPNNTTLVWDRLPMTVAFMALLSIIISEFINAKIGKILLTPLLLIGLLLITNWVVFNDLRLYAFVQFYPMLIIPVILIFFKSKYNFTIGYWLLLLAYVIAKLLEFYDRQVFEFLKVISGHSLKHLVSAIGLFVLYYLYVKRKRLE